MSNPFIRLFFLFIIDVIVGSVLGISFWSVVLLNIGAVVLAYSIGWIVNRILILRGCSIGHSIVTALNGLPLIYLVLMQWLNIPTGVMLWFLFWTFLASVGYSFIFGSDD